MSEVGDDFKKEVQEILDRERWQGYVSGKVEGALNVLYSLDLDKDKRIEILQDTVGLSRMTATEFIKPREIQDRILKSEKLSYEEKETLSSMMANIAMDEENVLEHPKQTIELIAALDQNKILEECLPQVDAWIEAGVNVSMSRVKEYIIEKYDLF